MEHISASQFSRFLDCRYNYHLWRQQTLEEREAQATLEMLRGRAIHEALSIFYRAPPPLRSPLSALPDDSAGSQMIEHFNRMFGQDSTQVPTQVEVKFSAQILSGVELVGVLDTLTVRTEERTISIGEHKTHSRKPNLYNLAHFSMQPVVYSWLLKQMYPQFVVTDIVYTSLWPSGAGRYTRRIFDLGKWDTLLPVLAKEMLSDSTPFPSYGLHCGWCPFQRVCLEEMGGVMDLIGEV